MWEAFMNWIFDVIQFFYNFCGDWGMAIIIVTVIFRLLVAPLMHKQTKSTFQMQKIQPLQQEIQQKYADDPQRQSQEMQKLYAEAKFNPLAGCLPMLLQMPIFIALFQVLRSMGDRVQGTNYEFYSLVPDLTMTPSVAFSDGFGTFLPYLLLMLIFAGVTFLPMVLQQLGNNSPQRNQTLIMAAVMSLMMLWLGWSSPAGVLLFWGVSGIIATITQQVYMRYLKKQDAEAENAQIEIKPVKVDVERKVRKKRPTKKR